MLQYFMSKVIETILKVLLTNFEKFGNVAIFVPNKSKKNTISIKNYFNVARQISIDIWLPSFLINFDVNVFAING